MEKWFVRVGGDRPIGLRYEERKGMHGRLVIGGYVRDRSIMESVGTSFGLDLTKKDPVWTQANKIRFRVKMGRDVYVRGLADLRARGVSLTATNSLQRIMV